MKAQIKGMKISFDLSELVEDMSAEDRTLLARLVAADKELFAGVLECVSSTGLFGHFFEHADGDWWFDNKTLLEFREKLLPLMADIARGAVEEALRQRNAANAEKERMYRWAYQLYHAWPEHLSALRPQGPERWLPTSDAEDAEVDALLKGQAPP